MRYGVLFLVVTLIMSGCSRAFYRRSADREVYQVEAEHADENRWPTGNVNIEPPPESRLFDPFNLDRPPMPPDDPAAYRFMERPNGIRGSRHFHDDGDAPFIEAPDWKAAVPLDLEGKLRLTKDNVVGVGLLHSREYQTALETVYLSALGLTLNRFDFACHWFLTNNTVFTQFGSSVTENNTLSTASTFGFTRNLYAGGQFLAEIANSFVFTFSGVNQTVATTNLMASVTQPLLRGAGRWVRMEGLTQAERNMLYSIRTFARFREQFYVTLTTQPNGYLGLLLLLQNVRNLEANVQSQEQNLRLHEALFRAQTVSTVQVDQALQSYLQAKLSLLQAQTSLQTGLDNYKITLGLPPGLGVTLDDSLLKPFQLAAPELEQLQGEVDRVFADFREREQLPQLNELQEGFAKLKAFHEGSEKLLDQVEAELKEWKGQLGVSIDEPAQAARERETYETLERQMPDLRRGIVELGTNIGKDAGNLNEARRQQGWDALQNRSRQFISELAQIFVFQTQVRVYLIRLKPVPYQLEEAREYAQANRLDLMNQRARVVDAWRQITVTASALKAGLNVTATANVATRPFADAPVDFLAAASTYTVGVQFDGPLNRLAERNAYRTSQINYQQVRRSFMALEDQIDASIRLDLRNLEQERTSFGIARLALVSAARGVEASRDKLLLIQNAADTASTLDILNALSALLNAETTLINSWISYESTRIQLLFDMDALRLTPEGVPANESDNDAADRPLATILRPEPAGDTGSR
jgi:outer membrane protein TolC